MGKLKHLQGQFYSNVLIIGKNGEPLSTVSTRKANWYLNRNLAAETTPPKPYPRAIQLNFTHKTKAAPEAWDLHICNDQCVMCAKTTTLSLHHIVPYVIRRHMPTENKNHSREWCVLLCTKCHEKVELVTQPVYKKDFPNQGPSRKSTNVTLQQVKASGVIDKIPLERLQRLFSLSDYKTIEDIPKYQPTDRYEQYRKISIDHRNAIKAWALKFIEEHGGVEGTQKYFLHLFMAFKPKHLPTWFEDLVKISG